MMSFNASHSATDIFLKIQITELQRLQNSSCHYAPRPFLKFSVLLASNLLLQPGQMGRTLESTLLSAALYLAIILQSLPQRVVFLSAVRCSCLPPGDLAYRCPTTYPDNSRSVKEYRYRQPSACQLAGS